MTTIETLLRNACGVDPKRLEPKPTGVEKPRLRRTGADGFGKPVVHDFPAEYQAELKSILAGEKYNPKHVQVEICLNKLMTLLPGQVSLVWNKELNIMQNLLGIL